MGRGVMSTTVITEPGAQVSRAEYILEAPEGIVAQNLICQTYAHLWNNHRNARMRQVRWSALLCKQERKLQIDCANRNREERKKLGEWEGERGGQFFF